MSLEHSHTRSGVKILRRKAAAEKIGVHVSTLMRYATDPNYSHLEFPIPVELGCGGTGFFDHELDAWALSRPRIVREAEAVD